MGDQFIGDLTKGFRNVSVSRKRALQLIGGAIAVAVPARIAPSAEAGKHSKPPLAVASVVLVDIQPSTSGTFTWLIKGAVVHKESGDQARLDTSAGIIAAATTDQTRKKLVSAVRSRAAAALKGVGQIVPEECIAMTLL